MKSFIQSMCENRKLWDAEVRKTDREQEEFCLETNCSKTMLFIFACKHYFTQNRERTFYYYFNILLIAAHIDVLLNPTLFILL